MKIPLPDHIGKHKKPLPEITGAYIKNPYPGKDLLTPEEALECINTLAGMLVIDKRYRKTLDGS